MSYREIIDENCRIHSPHYSWWPRFAYHFTDVTNAVSILKTGVLYSRNDAITQKLMQNDNASIQVIEHTYSSATSNVRLYFRPLNPTQYYNEGYKHPSLRYDSDINANIPLPVFFVFDLEKILELEGTRFSETTMAGGGARLLSGEKAFSKLSFDAIYSNGFENYNENILYRHAEIVCNSPLTIEPFLQRIICRNQVERTTLLNMLKETDLVLFNKYFHKIIVRSDGLFVRNGLFVEECLIFDNDVVFKFSDPFSRQRFIAKQKEKNEVDILDTVGATVSISWLFSHGYKKEECFSSQINYEKTKYLSFNVTRKKSGAQKIIIKLFIEDNLMCYVSRSLESGEVF